MKPLLSYKRKHVFKNVATRKNSEKTSPNTSGPQISIKFQLFCPFETKTSSSPFKPLRLKITTAQNTRFFHTGLDTATITMSGMIAILHTYSLCISVLAHPWCHVHHSCVKLNMMSYSNFTTYVHDWWCGSDIFN